METEISLDIENVDRVKRSVRPGLKSDGKVNYQVSEEEGTVRIKIQTDGIGPLRGSTDNAFRLSMLADKIYTR